MVSTVSIPTGQCLTLLSSSVAQSEPPCPRKIPLYIRLSDRLTSPAEAACAKAVAGYLSGRCGRVVSLAELEGLSLYLWSEDDPEGRELSRYLEGEAPLQGLLLEAMQEPGGDHPTGASSELAQYVGARFEFAAAAGMNEPTLLRERVSGCAEASIN